MKKQISRCTLIISIVIIISCKNSFYKKNSMSIQEQYGMIIKDYYKNNSTYIKKYDVFSIENRSLLNEDYYLYNFLPKTENNFYPASISNSYLPVDYIKYRGKIFLIHDENNYKESKPLHDVLKCLDSLNMLDSTAVKVKLGIIKPEDAIFRPLLSDGSKQVFHYVICKDKPYKITKRIKSRTYIKPDDRKFRNICD